MTKDDILKLAETLSHGWWLDDEHLEAFAALVAAHKAEVITAEAYRCGYKDGMEAAAVICDNIARKYQHAHNASSENIADECAAAIRARGTT